MKQQTFEQTFGSEWSRLQSIIDAPAKETDSDFPHYYRRLCQQLATAKERRYSPQLINQLNDLLIACHHRLYRHHNTSSNRWLMFILWSFPYYLRKNVRIVLIALLLFAGPLLAMGVGCYLNEELIYSVMDANSVRNMEAMYNPEARVLGRERASDTDLMMFGHYIKNNIGIGFQCFAGGILFGIGSIFILFYNGLVIGAVAGHLTRLGYTETFYPFVSGHAALELGAIVFCGAAGLKLGMALVDPGHLRRLEALKHSAKEAIIIVYGAALMLVLAAFVEAFWSSSSDIAIHIKYTVGATLGLLVVTYCCFMGRRRGPQ